MVARFGESEDAKSIQPFVISTSPAIKAAIGEGKRDNKGFSDCITTKKIAIIVPTEIMLIALSMTIELKSEGLLSILKCCFSLLLCNTT